ncbi:MAG: polysaccharide deacetylase family protein [Flavisolibacter sp.]
MKLLKKAYYTACSLLPSSIVKKISPVKTLLPYHHLVSDQDLLHIKHLYTYKSSTQFRNDLDYLLKNFHPVSADELSKAINTGEETPSNSFLLTFDDGFKEVYDVISPILLEKGIPAVFFVNPAFIDNKELFYRCKISLVIEELSNRKDALQIGNDLFKKQYSYLKELKRDLKKVNQLNKHILDEFAKELNYSFDGYLNKQKPFLTTVQLKDLSQKGFVIGAHSWDHPYYELLTVEEQLQQTLSSLQFVKETVGNGHSYFSFPHTDTVVSQQFLDKLKKDNIELLFGIQNQKTENQNKMLHRFNAERPDIPIKSAVNGVLIYCTIQKALGRYEIHRL